MIKYSPHHHKHKAKLIFKDEDFKLIVTDVNMKSTYIDLSPERYLIKIDEILTLDHKVTYSHDIDTVKLYIQEHGAKKDNNL